MRFLLSMSATFQPTCDMSGLVPRSVLLGSDFQVRAGQMSGWGPLPEDLGVGVDMHMWGLFGPHCLACKACLLTLDRLHF
jgi:hypothetical protein